MALFINVLLRLFLLHKDENCVFFFFFLKKKVCFVYELFINIYIFFFFIKNNKQNLKPYIPSLSSIKTCWIL
jgi:hypothetical protein